MRKIWLAFLLFVACNSYGQKIATFQYICTANGCNIPGNRPNSVAPINLISSGTVNLSVQWNVVGSISGGAFTIDGSPDSSTWTSGNILASQSATSNGNQIAVAPGAGFPNYAQLILNTPISGTGSLFITISQWNFYSTAASGKGINPSVTGRALPGDSPFCAVDASGGNNNLAACFATLNLIFGGSINGGTVSTNIPEEWNSQIFQNFTGKIIFNNGTQTSGQCTPATCWMACVPTIKPSRLMWIGVGTTAKGNMAQGTPIAYDPACFPQALGSVIPTYTPAAGGSIPAGPVVVVARPVNSASGCPAGVCATPKTPLYGRDNWQVVQSGAAGKITFPIPTLLHNWPNPNWTGGTTAYDQEDIDISTAIPGVCVVPGGATGCTTGTVNVSYSSSTVTVTLASGLTSWGNKVGAGVHFVMTGCTTNTLFNSVNSTMGAWVIRKGGGASNAFSFYDPYISGTTPDNGTCSVYIVTQWPVQNVAGTDLTCPAAAGQTGDTNACKAFGQVGNIATITAIAPYGTDNTRNTPWYDANDGTNCLICEQRGVWSNTNGSYDSESRDLTYVDEWNNNIDNPTPNCPVITDLNANGEEQSGVKGVAWHGGCTGPRNNGYTTFALAGSTCVGAGGTFTFTSVGNTSPLVVDQQVNLQGLTGNCGTAITANTNGVTSLNNLTLNTTAVTGTSFSVTLPGGGAATSGAETGTAWLGAGDDSVGTLLYSGASNSNIIEPNMGSSVGSNVGIQYGIIIDGFRKTFAAARVLFDGSVNPHCQGCSTTTGKLVQPAAVVVAGNFQGQIANPQVTITGLHAEVFATGAGMGAGSNACVLFTYGANGVVNGLGCSGGNANAIEISADAGNVAYSNVWGGGTNDVCDDEMNYCIPSNTSRGHTGATDMVIGVLGPITAAAPVSVVSGFSTGATTVAGFPTSFNLVIGSTPATSGVLGLPTMLNKWHVQCDDITQPGAILVRQSAPESTSQATLNFYNPAGTLTAPAQNDVIECSSNGH